MLQSSPELKKKEKKPWKGFLKSKNITSQNISKPTPIMRTPSIGIINTPNTTPVSATYLSPRPEKIPTRDPFADMQLNISFASILNNNKATLPQSFEFKEKCFICDEPLSSILQSERILKLTCGDQVHCECFKAYFSDEMQQVQESYTRGSTITFGKNCTGKRCDNTKKVILDTGDWNLVSARKLSLIPRRPAPHPSVNLTALKSTLDNPPARRTSRLPSSHTRSRSPSPNPTISTIATDFEEDKGVDNESIRNRLIRFLLDNCANVNLSKLFQLGQLRVADELSVCIEPLDHFQTRYVYLFDSCMVIWNKLESPVYVPVAGVKISSRGSILQVYQIDTPNSTLLQSTSSAIVEKWVVAISDMSLQIPGSVITSSIDTDATSDYSNDSTSDLDPDPDPDPNSNSNLNSDSDSDVDSDAELIQHALKDDTVDKWEELIIEIDHALVTN